MPIKTVLLGKAQFFLMTSMQLSRRQKRLHRTIIVTQELQGLLNKQPLHYTVLGTRYIDTHTKAIQPLLAAIGRNPVLRSEELGSQRGLAL